MADELVGPVGFLEIFIDPEDGQITFSYGARLGEQLPPPSNGQFYTEQDLAAMPIQLALTVRALHLINRYVQIQMQSGALSIYGQPEGGQIH